MATKKSVRVAPNVTDPRMRSPKDLTVEMDEDAVPPQVPDENHKSIFGNPSKTKEEMEAEQELDNNSQTGTILIIVFALIVIALVALIVWMLMKQNNDQRDEEEMKRLMAPGKNGMQTVRMPPYPQRGDPAYEAHQRNMLMMHNQQAMMQQQMEQMNANLQHQPDKSFSQAMAENSGKAVVAAQEAQAPVVSNVNSSMPSNSNANVNPNSNNNLTSNDVDDVLAKIQAKKEKEKAKAKSTSKPSSKPSPSLKPSSLDDDEKAQELTDSDKELLDKVQSQLDDEPIELDD